MKKRKNFQKFNKIFAQSCLILYLSLALHSCSQYSDEQSRQYAKIDPQTAQIEADSARFEAENARIEAELAKKFGESMGKSVAFIELPWEEQIPALLAKDPVAG